MTTRFIGTNAIELTQLNGETYCKMIDILKLIHHEYYEHENEDIRNMLDRMEARVCKNAFLNMPTTDKIEGVPPRYAVGKDDNGWIFFAGSEENEPTFENKLCKAAKFINYRDAEACADFLYGEWDVLDLHDVMSEEERWVRELRMPMPFDADDGNEDAIPVMGVLRNE